MAALKFRTDRFYCLSLDRTCSVFPKCELELCVGAGVQLGFTRPTGAGYGQRREGTWTRLAALGIVGVDTGI